MVKISGKTYPHRNEIKALGFRWDGRNKIWYAETVNNETLETLNQLRGLIIDVNGQETDNRTYKEKYGQCEDAPCCGCCGQSYYGTAGYDY